MSINHAIEVVRSISSAQTDTSMFGARSVLALEANAAIDDAIALRKLHGNPQGLYRLIVQFVLPETKDGAE